MGKEDWTGDEKEEVRSKGTGSVRKTINVNCE